MLNHTIRTWDDLYLQIAKLAKESGNEQMFKLALTNRQRTLRKEMERGSNSPVTRAPSSLNSVVQAPVNYILFSED